MISDHSSNSASDESNNKSSISCNKELETGPEPPCQSPPNMLFPAKTTLVQVAFRKSFDWILDQKTLLDAFLVALSFHIIMFPVLWFIGWALPWPKSPVITTIIEYDLRQWLKTGKPKKIFEFRDPKLNQ